MNNKKHHANQANFRTVALVSSIRYNGVRLTEELDSAVSSGTLSGEQTLALAELSQKVKDTLARL